MKDWNSIPSKEVIESTIKNIENRNINVSLVESKEEALEKLKNLMPEGAEVMTASSTSLHEIGFSDFLNSDQHKFINLQSKVWSENDEDKRGDLRRKALTSEYFIGSINAISQNGELIAVDQSGSRVGAYPYAAKNVIIVASVNKITANLEEAIQRIKEYVFPLEDKRALEAYGFGSKTNKWLIIEGEANPDRIKMILVKEKLGF